MQGYVKTATRASRPFVLLLALVVIALALAPLWASRNTLQDLFFILTMLSLAQFWNLLAGYGGLVSIGQQAFVGLGAYAMFGAVILLGIGPIQAILLGGIAALALAIPTAFFAFRLQGAYFAVGTWVVAEVVRLCVSMWQAVGGGSGTSLPRDARDGLIGLDQIMALFSVRGAEARDIILYWLALCVTVATVLGLYAFLRTRSGLALSAVRDNIAAARSVGVRAEGMRWRVFLIAAFGTGIIGALIFLQNGRISPDAAFSVTDWTAFVFFIVIIGGIGTIEGPIIGVLVLFALQSAFAQFGAWYLVMLGLLAIGVTLFAPKGLWGLISARTGLSLFPVRRRLILSDPSEDKP
ncbi:MAG: branched-chain amino acid ABC transporter permease [Tabrizicola sp.]|nr:branched-chain amino acid ABC transporter permease [Tabrizicola sp.]